MSRSPFDPLVEAYDAARPSYPAALLAEIEALAGPLRGRFVVEIGAGTGIATGLLRRRGARVLATDVGPAMLARLRRHHPDVPVALADGHALPVRSATTDLVACAQAWHWLDVAAAAAEAHRVLRPGGSLACWWNDVAAEHTTWWREQQRRLEQANPGYRRDYRSRDYPAEIEATGRFAAVRTATVHWSRRLDLDCYETWLRSKSYVAALGAALPDFLAAERASLRAAFPSGVVTEPFRVRLVVATRAAAGGGAVG